MAKLRKKAAPKKKKNGSQYAALRGTKGTFKKTGFSDRAYGSPARQRKRAWQNRTVLAAATHGIRKSKPKAFRGKKGKQAYKTLAQGIAVGMHSTH